MTLEHFSETYLIFSDDLYRVARSILDTPADAEDTLQDLFIKLWDQRDSLDIVRNPKAYCVTLLRNMCVDRLRRSSARPETPADELPLYSGEAADEWLVRREQLDKVRRAMDRLPENQRKALEMRVLQDLPYERISELTGLSRLSLRVLVSRARKTIKRQI